MCPRGCAQPSAPNHWAILPPTREAVEGRGLAHFTPELEPTHGGCFLGNNFTYMPCRPCSRARVLPVPLMCSDSSGSSCAAWGCITRLRRSAGFACTDFSMEVEGVPGGW